MTSAFLDRKEVRHATWRVQCEDRPAGGNTGRLFLTFGGRSAPTGLAYCPLDRVLTYKNLIYLLNLQYCSIKCIGTYSAGFNLKAFLNLVTIFSSFIQNSCDNCDVVNILITFAKKDTSLEVCICSKNNSKSYGQILMKFVENVGNGSRNRRFDFGCDFGSLPGCRNF